MSKKMDIINTIASQLQVLNRNAGHPVKFDAWSEAEDNQPTLQVTFKKTRTRHYKLFVRYDAGQDLYDLRIGYLVTSTTAKDSYTFYVNAWSSGHFAEDLLRLMNDAYIRRNNIQFHDITTEYSDDEPEEDSSAYSVLLIRPYDIFNIAPDTLYPDIELRVNGAVAQFAVVNMQNQVVRGSDDIRHILPLHMYNKEARAGMVADSLNEPLESAPTDMPEEKDPMPPANATFPCLHEIEVIWSESGLVADGEIFTTLTGFNTRCRQIAASHPEGGGYYKTKFCFTWWSSADKYNRYEGRADLRHEDTMFDVRDQMTLFLKNMVKHWDGNGKLMAGGQTLEDVQQSLAAYMTLYTLETPPEPDPTPKQQKMPQPTTAPEVKPQPGKIIPFVLSDRAAPDSSSLGTQEAAAPAAVSPAPDASVPDSPYADRRQATKQEEKDNHPVQKLNHTETAKLIRKDLKTTFPRCKFRVRCVGGRYNRYIEISWTDGPVAKMVQVVVDKYQGFYRKQQSVYNNKYALTWRIVEGESIQYVRYDYSARILQRDTSAALQAYCAAKIAAEYGYAKSDNASDYTFGFDVSANVLGFKDRISARVQQTEWYGDPDPSPEPPEEVQTSVAPASKTPSVSSTQPEVKSVRDPGTPSQVVETARKITSRDFQWMLPDAYRDYADWDDATRWTLLNVQLSVIARRYELTPDFEQADIEDIDKVLLGYINPAPLSVPQQIAAAHARVRALRNQPADKYATINWQDGKLRLYCENRLPKDEFKAMMNQGFKYVRGEPIFYAPYTPYREKFLSETYSIVELQDDDTDLRELAEQRADRYQGFSDNASKRSAEYQQRSKRYTADIPFGQPILIGHHSEKRHRAAVRKSWDSATKSVAEYDRAGHWQHRADAAIRSMDRKEKPQATARRITRLEADLRKFKRELDKQLGRSIHYTRWIWFTENRIAFERALLAALPEEDKPLTRDDLEVGGLFRRSDNGRWETIHKINRKTVTYIAEPSGFHLKCDIDNITRKNYRNPGDTA